HRHDCEARGFEWIDCTDAAQSVVAWLRRGAADDEVVLAACNFTPVPRAGYRLGVPCGGRWAELLNSDAAEYGGGGLGNLGGVEAEPVPAHGPPWSVSLTLPPLGAVLLRPGAVA
ncbi:MAG TPA: alpha amylase C-terminal domain-containing protein, partial [Burkholderiaceae bacterium]|nr:alpha amylase C-terminal domain-containing protein [Burkholderiaceae bacterium]